jgi:hypothetical protein
MSDTGQFAAAIIRYAASSFLPHSRRYTADRHANQRWRISRLRKIVLSPGMFRSEHVEDDGRL